MKKAVIFPGQGAQFAGMGKDLYDSFSVARDMFNKAEDVLSLPIKDICFNRENELSNTFYQQLAIFLVSAVSWRIFRANNKVSVDFFAGLSLGEYTALYAAGVVSFEDGLLLVKKRARAMDKASERNRSFMLALVGADKKDLEKKGELPFYIANLNCPGQVVVSVAEEKREEAMNFIDKMNIKRAVELALSGGFHSAFMDPARALLEEALGDVSFSNPSAPIVANVDALDYVDSVKIKENLLNQLTMPVLWQKSVEFMRARGVDVFFEIGPSKVLKGLLRKIDKTLKVFNFSKAEDFTSILQKEEV